MANANKWIGGTLIALGALTDVGAVSGARSAPIGEAAGLAVGTGAMVGGFWLWNEEPIRSGQRHSRRAGDTRTRRGRQPRYTGRAR